MSLELFKNINSKFYLVVQCARNSSFVHDCHENHFVKKNFLRILSSFQIVITDLILLQRSRDINNHACSILIWQNSFYKDVSGLFLENLKQYWSEICLFCFQSFKNFLARYFKFDAQNTFKRRFITLLNKRFAPEDRKVKVNWNWIATFFIWYQLRYSMLPKIDKRMSKIKNTFQNEILKNRFTERSATTWL